MKKWLLISVVAAISIFVVFWIVNSSNEINNQIEKSVNTHKKETNEKAVANNINIIETQFGKKLWDLKADKAVYENKNALLTNISGQFYDDKGKILLIFKAPQGNYIQDKHELSLNKNITIEQKQANIILNAETVSWTNKNPLIIAKGKIKIVKKGFGTSYSDKAIFSKDFTKISLEGNTYTEVNFSG